MHKNIPVDELLSIKGNIRFLPKLGLIVSAVLVLCNYYYFYLFDFNQGSPEGVPFWYNYTKIVALFILYPIILKPIVKIKFNYTECLIFLSLFYSVVILSIKNVYWNNESAMFINFLMCSLPILLLRANEDVRLILFFLDACLVVLIVQVTLDQYIYYFGYSLWDKGLFIGGLGNPSSFGFLCNIFIAYCLFFKQRSLLSTMAILVLLYGVVMTSSLMPVMLASGIIIANYLKKGQYLYLIISIVCVGAFFESILSEYLIYKIASLLGLASSESVEGSRSISLRYDIHYDFYTRLAENFTEIMFFGYSETAYHIADSQYLTYFGSVGVIGASLFFIAIIHAATSSYKCEHGFGLFVVFFLYLLIFLTNRILDYYPIALFLFIMIVLAKRPEQIQGKL